MKYSSFLFLNLLLQSSLHSQNYTASLQIIGAAGSQVVHASSKWRISYSVGEVAIAQHNLKYRPGFQQVSGDSGISNPRDPAGEDFNTVITPNGDGYNDDFRIDPPIIEPSDFTAYDKWGTQIYQELDFDGQWDLTDSKMNPLINGVYAYLILDKRGKVIHKGTISISNTK
ncbi:MAG: gliding motility-associated C-terminal domain-containing protein [Saprospiraceae bacterium]|nr:gliding motility-associated C-terminal domain-containing protein [Saprospiraceae bacterium]